MTNIIRRRWGVFVDFGAF